MADEADIKGAANIVYGGACVHCHMCISLTMRTAGTDTVSCARSRLACPRTECGMLVRQQRCLRRSFWQSSCTQKPSRRHRKSLIE